jgi:hypothetical protein
MGYIQFSNDNGKSWVNLEDATSEEVESLSVDVFLAEMDLQPAQLLCFTCLAPIPDGTGESFCDTHK